MIIVCAAFAPFSISKTVSCVKFDISAIKRAISIVSALSAYLVLGHIVGDTTALAMNAPLSSQGTSAALDDNIITGDIKKRKPMRRVRKMRRAMRNKPQVKYDKWGFKVKPKRGKKRTTKNVKQTIKKNNKLSWFSFPKTREETTTNNANTGGRYRTMCVRLRDGYYWPLSFKAKYSELKRDAERCAKSCMDPVRMFYGVSPGKKIANMRDLDGKTYKSLKHAFRYRKEYVKEATCKPQPWTLAAKERHRYFASPASFTSEIRYFGGPEFIGEKQLMATRINIRKLSPPEETTWVNKLAPNRKYESSNDQIDIAKIEMPPVGALMYERQKFAVIERLPEIVTEEKTETPKTAKLQVTENMIATVRETKKEQVEQQEIYVPILQAAQNQHVAEPKKPKIRKFWFADLKFKSDGKVFARTQYHYMRRRKKITVTSTRPWELQSAGRRVES